MLYDYIDCIDSPLLQVMKSLNSFSDAKLSLEYSVWRLYEVNDAFV